MILQTGGAVPRSAVELVLTASTETKVVLIVTAVFSLVSWFIIVLKWWQFRRLNKQADRFFAEMERTTRLQDAYHAVMDVVSYGEERPLNPGHDETAYAQNRRDEFTVTAGGDHLVAPQ